MGVHRSFAALRMTEREAQDDKEKTQDDKGRAQDDRVKSSSLKLTR